MTQIKENYLHRNTAELFETALLERMTALLPTFSSSALAARASAYLQAREHKAQAISFAPSGTWRTTDRETREAAAEKVLEACQVFHGAPCALIATNNDLEAVPQGGAPRRVVICRKRLTPTYLIRSGSRLLGPARDSPATF